MSSSPDFAGKTVVITGGGAGFGEAFAHAFAVAGASVALFDTDEVNLTRVCDDLTRAGHRAVGVGCDVSDEQNVARAMTSVAETFGGIDVLINNAGLHLTKYARGFGDLTPAEIRRLFEVNVMGVINGCQTARPFMAERGGGAIVNIASIAAYLANSPYGVSKLAVRGLTIAFSQEFSADHIRVNAIAPGLIATPVVEAELPELFDTFVDTLQHVKRRGEMADIVSMTLHLCASTSGFITGETIKVSGGYPLHI